MLRRAWRQDASETKTKTKTREMLYEEVGGLAEMREDGRWFDGTCG